MHHIYIIILCKGKYQESVAVLSPVPQAQVTIQHEMSDVIHVNFIPSGTVEYGQLNMAPYSTVALHTLSMEQVCSCEINVGILFFNSKYTTSLP